MEFWEDYRYLKQIRFHGGSGGGFPFRIPAIRHRKELDLPSPVTFLVGENGTGKSTILEAVAEAFGFNPEGGSRNFNFSTTEEEESPLSKSITLVKGVHRPKDGYFLRAESFFNVASEIDRLDRASPLLPSLLSSYGGKSLHHQSHGESFLSLMMNRFSGKGLYLLDEPEAALSPTNQMAILCIMDRLVKDQSQFIIATHSPILTAYPGAAIYQLSEEGIEQVEYRQSNLYTTFRSFLENPDRVIRELFRE